MRLVQLRFIGIGEITTKRTLFLQLCVNRNHIGYDSISFDGNAFSYDIFGQTVYWYCTVLIRLWKQRRRNDSGQLTLVLRSGYDVRICKNVIEEFMPYPISLAHKLLPLLKFLENTLTYLDPMERMRYR